MKTCLTPGEQAVNIVRLGIFVREAARRGDPRAMALNYEFHRTRAGSPVPPQTRGEGD